MRALRNGITRRVFVAFLVVATVVIMLMYLLQDTRVAAVAIWGFGTFAVWAAVFRKTVLNWRFYKDSRARHDLLSDGALLIVAGASAVAITLGLTGIEGRALAGSIALGAFLMAGVVKLTEAPPDPPEVKDVEGHRRIIAKGR